MIRHWVFNLQSGSLLLLNFLKPLPAKSTLAISHPNLVLINSPLFYNLPLSFFVIVFIYLYIFTFSSPILSFPLSHCNSSRKFRKSKVNRQFKVKFWLLPSFSFLNLALFQLVYLCTFSMYLFAFLFFCLFSLRWNIHILTIFLHFLLFFFVKLPRQTLLANYRCYRCYHLMCDVSIADLSTFEQCWTIVKVNYIDFGQREFCRVCLCSTFSKDNHKSFIRICTSV